MGTGTWATVDQPLQQVPGLDAVTKIAAGSDHTCALLDDGTAVCWGAGGYGQLGDGTNTSRPAPVAVSDLTGVVALAVNGDNSCALLGDGGVSCWGRHGLTAASGDALPVPIDGVQGAIGLTTGTNHSCALLADGTGSCWGGNQYGQLGTGGYPYATLPVAVQWR